MYKFFFGIYKFLYDATIKEVESGHDNSSSKKKKNFSLLIKVEHAISPLCEALKIMPLFVFANAGVSLEGQLKKF